MNPSPEGRGICPKYLSSSTEHVSTIWTAFNITETLPHIYQMVMTSLNGQPYASVATTFVTEALSMKDDASPLRNINWRSIPCVPAF
jgi:hypothetical protein